MNAVAHRESDEAILKLGRANTSCKECLPLILTTGTLLSYIQNGKRPDEVLVYFMPTGSGPCRFGQYSIFMEDLIRRLEIPNVAMFALTAENSYAGMEKDFERRGWWAVVVSDVMEDIRAMLLANAADTRSAMATFEGEWENILATLEKGDYRQLEKQLQQSAASLGRIPQKRPPETVPVITLAGEIFVRRDALSRQFLTEELARRGFATVCSPVAEWVKYCNWVIDEGINDSPVPVFQRLKLKLRNLFQNRYERRIKAILSSSNLVHSTPVEVDTLVQNAAKHLSPELQGEAILTVGGSMTEIVSESCGVIAIGPFGCMPNRLSEAILNETMTAREKLATDSANQTLASILTEIEELPFLAIESDGSPFPQVITAKLETFCLRAGRLHERMLAARPAH
jgi:predicted nucleotide-binding protein (sugar kinase/HSP70/actin superfamily)